MKTLLWIRLTIIIWTAEKTRFLFRRLKPKRCLEPDSQYYFKRDCKQHVTCTHLAKRANILVESIWFWVERETKASGVCVFAEVCEFLYCIWYYSQTILALIIFNTHNTWFSQASLIVRICFKMTLAFPLDSFLERSLWCCLYFLGNKNTILIPRAERSWRGLLWRAYDHNIMGWFNKSVSIDATGACFINLAKV